MKTRNVFVGLALVALLATTAQGQARLAQVLHELGSDRFSIQSVETGGYLSVKNEDLGKSGVAYTQTSPIYIVPDGTSGYTKLEVTAAKKAVEGRSYLGFRIENFGESKESAYWIEVADELGLFVHARSKNSGLWERGFFVPGHIPSSGYLFLEGVWVNPGISKVDSTTNHPGRYFLTATPGDDIQKPSIQRGELNNLDNTTAWQLVPRETVKVVNVGNAETKKGIVEHVLTEDKPNQKGAIWTEHKINFNKDFVISADVYLGTKEDGADGLALVFQGKDNHTVGDGGGMGYQGISPSFAVEIDTYQNLDAFGDPAEDHVGISIDGNPRHKPSDYVRVDNLEDDKFHSIKFEWNAAKQSFNFSLDGKRLFTEHRFHQGALTDQQVYFGFTAATGQHSNLQKVRSIYYSN